MKVLVSAPTIIGGVVYEASHLPQDVPDNVGHHLIEIGNAAPYETKVVKPEVTKVKKTSSASQPAPASQEQTPKKRRGRPRKSSS